MHFDSVARFRTIVAVALTFALVMTTTFAATSRANAQVDDVQLGNGVVLAGDTPLGGILATSQTGTDTTNSAGEFTLSYQNEIESITVGSIQTADLPAFQSFGTVNYADDPFEVQLPEVGTLRLEIVGSYYPDCDYNLAIVDACAVDEFCDAELAVAGLCDEASVFIYAIEDGPFGPSWSADGTTTDGVLDLPVFLKAGARIVIDTIDAASYEFIYDGTTSMTVDLGAPPREIVTVSGTVTAGDEPLADVLIGDGTVRTDDNGYFSVDVPAGTEGIYLSSTHYSRPEFNLFYPVDTSADADVAIELPAVIYVRFELVAACLYSEAIIDGCPPQGVRDRFSVEAVGTQLVSVPGAFGMWTNDTTSFFRFPPSAAMVVFDSEFQVSAMGREVGGVADWDGSNPFKVPVTEEVRPVVATMVVGDTPVVGATVIYRNQAERVTDANGQITFNYVEGSFLVIGARRDATLDYPGFSLDWSLLGMLDADTDTVTLGLPESDTVTVRVNGPGEYRVSGEVRFNGSTEFGIGDFASWSVDVETVNGLARVPVLRVNPNFSFDIVSLDDPAINTRVPVNSNDLVVDLESPPYNWYIDLDRDGFGATGSDPIVSVEEPETISIRYVRDNRDCDDSTANVNPFAAERAGNLVDENCDGVVENPPDDPNLVEATVSVRAGSRLLSGVEVRLSGSDYHRTGLDGTFTIFTPRDAVYEDIFVWGLYADDFDYPFFRVNAEMLVVSDENTIDIVLPEIEQLEVRVNDPDRPAHLDIAPGSQVRIQATPFEAEGFTSRSDWLVSRRAEGDVVDLPVFAGQDFFIEARSAIDGRILGEVPWLGDRPQFIDLEALVYTQYLDRDGDGFGDSGAEPFISASRPRQYAFNNLDCDDNNDQVNPFADEVLGNDIDENCDGELVDGPVVTATCLGAPVTIDMRTGAPGIGTDGDDVILGTSGDDVIKAMGGNDKVCAGAGNDVVNAGAGNDTVVAGAGDDRVYGLSGDDDLRGWGGADLIRGGGGADLILGGAGDDDLGGGANDDVVRGQGGHDFVHGNAGNDLVSGDDDHDEVVGGPGQDTLRGGHGDDELRGQEGADLLLGGAGDDGLFGGDDNDRLISGTGFDRVFGGAGIDACADLSAIDISGNCESRIL